MFDLHKLDEAGHLATRYTLVTCWAPATPTFAYEPTRLSEAVIQEDLRRSKGAFRHVRYEGESALEVQHGERALIFPAWKFDIRGPVALLNLMARRGLVGVLGAVDSQVFWEILAQLLQDARYRPQNQPFNPENLPIVFGIISPLDATELGSHLTHPTRHVRLPGVSDPAASLRLDFGMWIRRGAVFPGSLPAVRPPIHAHARRESALVSHARPGRSAAIAFPSWALVFTLSQDTDEKLTTPGPFVRLSSGLAGTFISIGTATQSYEIYSTGFLHSGEHCPRD
jgi:hypothetical protein